MSVVLFATIAGIITAFCWGIGDWMQARSSKAIGANETYFAVTFLGIIMLLLPLPFFSLDFPDSSQFITILASGTCIAIAYLCFMKALSSGAVGMVVPLGNTYPLFTLLLSIVVLNQVFESIQIAAMAAIVIGAAILAYEKNHKKIPLKTLHKDTALAFVASLFWGVGFFIMNPLFGEVSWQIIFLITNIIMVLLGMAFLVKNHGAKAGQAMKRSLVNKPVVYAALILNAGAFAFYIGSDYAGNVIIPAVLSASAPLVASFLGAYIDKEKLGILKRIGAVIIVSGIIILNIA
jgi:drug/metabolite transporter (DMT)-like permease